MMNTVADFEVAISSKIGNMQFLYRFNQVDLQARCGEMNVSEINELERALTTRMPFMSAYHASQLRQKLDSLRPRNPPSSIQLDNLTKSLTFPKEASGHVSHNGHASHNGHVAPNKQSSSYGPIEGVLRLKGLKGEAITVTKPSNLLFLSGLSDCDVVLGPCSGAAFMDDCHDSRITVSAHQLRLTACHNLTLSCFVATSVNLEKCTAVKIQELQGEPYPEYKDHMVAAGLAGLSNQVKKIVDFTNI